LWYSESPAALSAATRSIGALSLGAVRLSPVTGVVAVVTVVTVVDVIVVESR
jgi:hypothetical protein